VKEATANMDVATEIAMRCGGGLTLLSGDDSLALPLAAVGGRGVMSVASNLVPDEMVELVRLATSNSGEAEKALALQTKLFPLFQSMVAEVNPVPVKVGMELLGLCPANLRLPLLRATPATEAMVRDALAKVGKL
jgi:4-hydroxy-tetrahydrodipicolinate synthase